MQNDISRKVLAVSAAAMAAFYILIGFVVMIYPIEKITYLTEPLRIVLGSAIILYGGFRGYRAYRRWQEP
jgi:formate hydrogenlyase subunit 3/multisubunit Na+/H+ antiporter MnhD subunit